VQVPSKNSDGKSRWRTKAAERSSLYTTKLSEVLLISQVWLGADRVRHREFSRKLRQGCLGHALGEQFAVNQSFKLTVTNERREARLPPENFLL
jgi:hypothetical protein